MADSRECGLLCDWAVLDMSSPVRGPAEHRLLSRAMPLFPSGRTARNPGYGNPHAATLIEDDGQIRAAHLSCVLSYRVTRVKPLGAL